MLYTTSKGEFGNAVLDFMNHNKVIDENSEEYSVLKEIFEKKLDELQPGTKITHKLGKNKYRQWYVEETLQDGVFKDRKYMVYVY